MSGSVRLVPGLAPDNEGLGDGGEDDQKADQNLLLERGRKMRD